jgi:hypothetical protein
MPSSILRNRNRKEREPIVLQRDENHCKSHSPSYRLDLECLSLLELEDEYPSRNPRCETQHNDQQHLQSCLERKSMSTTGSAGPATIRSVKFQSLYIRTYNQVLGDHPCCTSGLPISLGWTYKDEQQISINDYEICRIPRRNRCDLRLNDLVRRNIIMSTDFHQSPCSSDDECSYSEIDLRKAERRAYRQRDRMVGRKRNSRIASQFFNCPNSPVVGAE